MDRPRRILEAGKYFEGHAINYRRDGTPYQVEWNISLIWDPGEGAITHFVSVQQDVTEHQQRIQQMRLMSTALEESGDWLTGVAKRRRFDEMLEKEFERSQRYQLDLALITLDADRFKPINDRYGHEVSDGVLKAMSQVVEESLRLSDQLGRWCGEEFVVLAPRTGKEGAQSLAERLRATVASASFSEVGQVIASFGVTTRRPEDTLRRLVKGMDEVLYQAKEGGRNRIELL